MQKIKQHILQYKWELLTVCFIILVGIFLRTFHFSDWLLFEIDQTYDTRIVSRGVQDGISNLPLLGPTAGGGRALRLGPAFYYLEYAAAKIFGDQPVGHAMNVLLSSILAMPFFYLLVRRYFSKRISYALLSIFATSVFLVFYGRFSWSPNVLPFLIILSFYSLLKSTDEHDPKKEHWFLLSTAAITITSQIHFNAFFTIPPITIAFLLYKRPKFKFKTWILAIAIFFLFYSPMAISDIKTHGENIGFFLKKTSKGGSILSNVDEKLISTVQYISSEYSFIVTGVDKINGGRLKGLGFKDKVNVPWRIFSIFLVLMEFLLLIWLTIKEKEKQKKDFLILIGLWFSLSSLYYYSLVSSSYNMFPRFFLPVAPLAIILFGFLLNFLSRSGKRLGLILLSVITIIIIYSSVTNILDRFSILAGNSSNKTIVEREDIFPNAKRLTLQEQMKVVDYINKQYQKNKYPVYIDTYHEYEDVLWYHLSKIGIQYNSSMDWNNTYVEGNYFLIKYPSDGVGKIESKFNIKDTKNFGILTVYTLSPQNPSETKQAEKDKTKLIQTKQINQLMTWKEIF